MRIHLDDSNPFDYKPLYFAGRSRLSSLTSVRFVEETRLACANLAQRRLYLIEFDVSSGSSAVLDAIDTLARPPGRARLKPSATDLLDYDPTRRLLAATHPKHRGISLYVYEGDSLRFERWIPLEEVGPIHGVRFVPHHPDVLAVCSTNVNNPNAGLHFVSIADGTGSMAVHYQDWAAKDLAFFGSQGRTFFLLLLNQGTPRRRNKSVRYGSRLVLAEVQLGAWRVTELDRLELNDVHCDGCVALEDSVLVTAESAEHQGTVMELSADLEDGKLSRPLWTGGFAFPHGIDARNSLVAITEYSTCSIVFEDLADLRSRARPHAELNSS